MILIVTREVRLRVLTLRYDPVLDAFDDGQLRELLKDRELIAARDHFFLHGGEPRLALLVTYRAAGSPSPASNRGAGTAGLERSGEHWRELLGPDDLPLFNTLREWRAERARRDGVPPYVVCTNRQLALAVRARPASLAKLGEVDGFGRGKLERYGADLLALLRTGEPRVAAAEASDEPGETIGD